MPQPLEPTLAALPNPALRYFAATRPAFLSVTFVGCLLGLATAAASGALLDPPTADVGARCVSMLAQLGEPIDSPKMKAALAWRDAKFAGKA